MKVSLLTPTGGRLEAFKACEEWMKRQTIQPYEWIVVDDYIVPTQCTMGQKVIRRQPFWEIGEMTLQLNLIEGLKAVTGDIVLIIEDDDWYSPTYIESMVNKFKKYHEQYECSLQEFTPSSAPRLLIGEALTRYYDIKRSRFQYHANMNHASLFQTGFTSNLIPEILNLLDLYKRVRWFDGCMWKELKSCEKIMFLTKKPLSIGIKGANGRYGVGIGHHENEKLNFLDEKPFASLKQWIGDDDFKTLGSTFIAHNYGNNYLLDIFKDIFINVDLPINNLIRIYNSILSYNLNFYNTPNLELKVYHDPFSTVSGLGERLFQVDENDFAIIVWAKINRPHEQINGFLYYSINGFTPEAEKGKVKDKNTFITKMHFHHNEDNFTWWKSDQIPNFQGIKLNYKLEFYKND